MPQNCSNHFVPKCLLKQFASDSKKKKKQISLFHAASGHAIHGAAIKHQCARDYFYGKDGIWEARLGKLEGDFSKALAELDGAPPSEEVLDRILAFALIQSIRTEQSLHRQKAFMHIHDPLLPKEWSERIDAAIKPESILENIPFFLKAVKDLRIITIHNSSRVKFTLSDDPAVIFNRFYAQRKPTHLGGGLESAGMAMVLPLNPETLMLAYDRDVYTVDGITDSRVKIFRDRDAEELNQFQYIHANECVYFHDQSAEQAIQAAFSTVSDLRPDRWFDVTFAIATEAVGDHQKYDVVCLEEAVASRDNVLIHASARTLQLRQWPRLLKIRHQPKFHDTRTGRGLVRFAHADSLM